MAITNLIFDIGNVLIGYRAPDMLKDHGLTNEEIDRFSRKVFADPLWREFDLENIPYEEVVNLYVEKYPEEETLIRWVFSNTHLMPVHWPKVWEKVHALKEKGYRLYLLSNYSSVFFANHIEGLPFLEDVDGAVISWQIHEIKPEKVIYQTLLDKYSLNPSESVFFDDRQENVEAARNMGITAYQIHDQNTILELTEHFLKSNEAV